MAVGNSDFLVAVAYIVLQTAVDSYDHCCTCFEVLDLVHLLAGEVVHRTDLVLELETTDLLSLTLLFQILPLTVSEAEVEAQIVRDQMVPVVNIVVEV